MYRNINNSDDNTSTSSTSTTPITIPLATTPPNRFEITFFDLEQRKKEIRNKEKNNHDSNRIVTADSYNEGKLFSC